MPNSADFYGPMGSVPEKTDTSGSGARPLSVRANADDFGAQIGGAEQRLGNEAQQQVDRFGGMILETAANDAEVGFTKDAGAIKAKYSQYSGLQAEAMRPQYEADLAATREKWSANLPLKSQHQFLINTNNTVANDSARYNEYAATQVKAANINSQGALMDTAVSKTGDLGIVLDDKQFGEQVLAPIIHSGNALADLHGYSAVANGEDVETGHYSYPDTPEGKAAEAAHMAVTNGKLASAYFTAAQTVADNQGAAAAADWSKRHWDDMPDAAKVQLNKFLAPKMKNEIISGNIASQDTELENGWVRNTLMNVPASPTEQINSSPLATIRRSEGYTGKVGQDSNSYDVINGINAKYFPNEVKELQEIYKTQGKDAGEKYTDNFYQKNFIDKYDIKSLPANTQAIVADHLVNGGGEGAFAKSLIGAAKNGASPLALIDMRRKEYERLNATGDPQYTSSFKGWTNRLNNLQQQEGEITYPNKVDYLRANEESFVKNVTDAYLEKYPEDYYGAQIQERRARTHIQQQIKTENDALDSDKNIITSAINGSLTKGKLPSTYEELRLIPGVAPILDKTMQQQGKFFGTIDTMIAKANHRESEVNTDNGYDAILNALDTSKDFTRQARIDYLSKGLGSTNPGYSISYKDFQDAKPAIDLDPTIKSVLSAQVKQIAMANGNIDGKGQQRAIQWYNQTMKAWQQNETMVDKKLSPSEFASSIGKKQGPPMPSPPSRMQQIYNAAAEKATQAAPVTITTKEQRDALPSGTIYIRDDQQYTKQ